MKKLFMVLMVLVGAISFGCDNVKYITVQNATAKMREVRITFCGDTQYLAVPAGKTVKVISNVRGCSEFNAQLEHVPFDKVQLITKPGELVIAPKFKDE